MKYIDSKLGIKLPPCEVFDKDTITKNHYKDTVIVVVTDACDHKVDVITGIDVKANSDDIVIVS